MAKTDIEIARVSAVLATLHTIKSFEWQKLKHLEAIATCEQNKSLPRGNALVECYKKQLEGIRQRLRDEWEKYYAQMEQLKRLAPEQSQALPELPSAIYDDENSIESIMHRNRCGGH